MDFRWWQEHMSPDGFVKIDDLVAACEDEALDHEILARHLALVECNVRQTSPRWYYAPQPIGLEWIPKMLDHIADLAGRARVSRDEADKWARR